MPGATVVPKTEQQPQPGIVAPAQINLVAQSALKPNASFGVHSPSPLPTVNTVTESEPIFSTTTLSTITIQGQKNHTFKKKSYHQGIEIKGQSTVGNTGDLSISTSHKNHPAVKVSEGSIVTLKGNDDKLLTLQTTGAHSPGLLASDTDTEIIANKIDITTQGENSEGVKIVNDARVIMNDSNITENGENAYGVWAEGEKTHLMANNVEIELNAQNATGIKAVNGGMVHIVESSVTANDDNSDGLITEGDKTNLRANDLEIEINGHNSNGVKALQGGAGIIENSSIIGHGNAFVGLSAAHEKTHLTGKNLNIEVQNGPKGTGVAAAKGAQINIENGTIIGTGKDFIGLLAADQKTNLEVNQMSIQANAEDSQGVIAENGAKVTVENSSIIGNWENFDGLRSRGENANLTANNTKIELHRENSRGVNIENGAKVDIKNGSQIITRGASSPAIQLTQKGRLNVSDSAIKTFGKNSATFYVAPGNSDKKSVAEMTGGSLQASGDLILSQGGTMDVVLNKVSVSSPGSGYLVNVLNSDSGYPGEVSLSVLNPIGEKDPTKTLRGNIAAAEGRKANVTLNNSHLIGSAKATHMSIDTTSQWSITGLSTLKQLNNEGKVEFQGPSATSLHPMATPVYKTLSLGSLSGTGMFWMNTDIAGHQGDFLNVRGKAEGKFGVMVNDSGTSPTAEDSLKIIQTGGGDARFTLANEGGVVDVGTYQYYLVPDDSHQVPDDINRVLDDRQRGWSLVSHQPQPSTKPKPESELNPKTPVTPSTPPEVAVVTAASGETVPRGMIEQGSPGQAPTVPETNQPATVSFIQTVAAGGTPGSVEAMRPEVIQTSPPPVAAPVFLSPTAYNIDQSGPVSSKEKTTEKTEDKNLFDDGESHTLAENGVYEKGIEIKNRTTVQSLENQGTVSISSDQNAKSAVKASESAIVTLKGNEDKLITVRTTGNHSPGLLASGTGTTITTDKMVIITEGQRSEGIKVHGGATAIINNGIITGEGESFNKGLLASGEKSNFKGNNLAITLTGNHGEGVVVERGAEVIIEDSSINVEKENSILNNGMTAFGENTTLKGNKLTMNVNGINGIGVSVIGGAKAIIEESRLNSKGLNFQGLYASGHGSYLMANKMEMEVDVGNDTNNKIGAGALAKSAGKIDIKHSTLTGKGENFSVLRAEEDNAHVEGNTLTINVAGTKGTGVAAKNTGVVIINDSTINGTEENFVGLLAQNQSQLKGKNITINAKGKNGRGVTALTNTDVVIEESKIIAEKENFYGLEARGENAKLTANKLDIKIQGESGIGAKTANGAKIIMNDSDITGTADDFSGVLAHEDHTSLEGNNLNINVNGQNSRGVKVYNGGEVKIHGGRINSQGDRFLGLAAYQEKTNLEGNNLTIESKGKNGTGVKADSGAQVSLRESNINGTGDAFLGLVASGKNTNLTTNNRLKMEIKGQYGIGVKANSGAEVNVNDTTINGIGDDFLGIEAYQDETNLKSNNMTINVNGQNGAAIKIYKEAMANLRGTTIIGTGDYFSGLEAYQEKTNLEGNNLKIQSNGKNSRGIKAHNGAKADIHDSTVTGTGEGFLGLLAFGEKTHLTGHHLMIDINDAKNGRAVTAVNAQVGLNDSSITGTGENFIGIGAYQEKANFTGNKLTVKANGQNSKGITVQDGAHLSMNDSTVTTHEKNSAILYTLYKEDPDEDADNTKRKSVAEITRGSLEASGNLIVSEGGIMDVVLNNVSVFSRETADVLNVINQGDVNLVANQTNLTGNVFAAPGSKANVTLNKSTLVGWANATNLSVDSGSKWLSTGPSVLKDLKNEGKVQFQSPSVNATGTPGYQTLSLESLSGTGMFWMNTDIAGHQGDFLNVTGKAQGAFGVMVADSGKSPTAEDSLQIIQTGGGDARFTLANQGGVVDVGTYQYHLVPDDNNQVPDDRHRVLDDRARGWSLVSHRSQIKPPTHKGEELTPTPSVVTASASETGAGETQPDAHPESSSVSPTGEKVAEGAIALQKNLFDDGKSHMLSENSLYSDGIEVKNKTTVENTGAVTISSSRDSNSAVKVSEASTVTLKGAEDKRVTLTPSGSGSHALHASGTGTQVTANKIDITTHRDGTQGVKVDEGARVNIDHSTMTGNGEDAYGLWAGGEKTNLVGNHLKIKINAQNGTGVASIAAQKVNIEDSEITGTGDGIFGLVAQYTDLEGKNVEIGVKGKKGKGLRAIQASKVNINDSRMVGEGENFQGIFAHGERTNVTVKKLKIEAKGKNGEGVMALSGAHVNIQDSTLSSDEEAFVGLSVSEDKSNLMVNKTTIKANGQDSKGVKAEKGATVDIQESTINSTGDDFVGLTASEKNTHLTSNNLKIKLNAQKGKGIEVKEGANLTANHLNIEAKAKDSTGVIALSEATVSLNNSTINAQESHSLGLLASGDQTHLTGNQLNIKVDAQDSEAVKVEKGAKVDIQQGSTITGNGKNFYGLLATEDQSKLIVNQTTIIANGQYGRGLQVVNGAEGIIEDSTITSTGENFHSLWADKSNLKGKKLTIESKGEKGHGVLATDNAHAILNDSKMTGTGKDFLGLWARGNETKLEANRLSIEVQGQNGKGVSAQSVASVMIDGSTLISDGDSFVGLVASGKDTNLTSNHLKITLNRQQGKGIEVNQGANLTGNQINIELNEQESSGIMALSDSMVNLNNSKIIAKDSLSLGLLASGDKTNITGNHINMELNGQNSLGVVVEKGATINMKDSTMTTLGVLSHAARLSKKGTLNVTDSRITTLGENSAILYVDSDDPKQKSKAEITRGFLEASGDLMLSKGAALDVVLNNVAISSPGSGYALNVLNSDSGHPGHVNLVVNETTLPGRIFTAKGSKAQVRLKRSELIGEVDATNLSVDADSLWTLTGNSVLKELIHGGKIAFKPHNDMSSNQIKAIDYSTLYLDTLSGQGTFWMNTDIAGKKGDFLHVRGEANGQFDVRVTDSGKSPKAEDSLKIIQTGGGEAEFTLTNPGQVVDVGTYQYHLVPDNHKRGWSLVSHQPQPSEKPQPESESPPKASVIPSATETVAASRPISGDTLLPKETEHSVQPGIGSKATELKPAVPVMSSVPEEKETVLTPVSGETVAPAVTDETQTRKLAPKAPEPKPEAPVAPSVPKEKETVLTPVSGETVAPAVTDETQTRKLAPKAPEPKPEAPGAPSVPKEKETVLTPVSGETVAPAVTDETQTRKLAPKAPEPKPEAPVMSSVEKEGEKKVAPNRLLSPPTNVSRTNQAPDIPSITPSTAAVLSMSTVGPLIYHS
ncbi:putative outer membrane autotransporter, pertactin domain protein [Candidatus Hamiltonella defensa 5AT (Acyrthosiphon pisum)]|uniref:Outer membrane autotransporter, pertactin domain protein n=2 Tax=Candidatus Williamhamiltonella defendens TaxID=138072 RepID=C4K5V6_HAMD5|nr:putative outer membrane autotransporter, pertactin domain protein [Candidatus Hamiltonella defensa 5AT (Acyrthosiphon pisum)]